MVVEVGLGAAEALSVPGTGRVVGVYAKAAYLRLPGGLMALTTRDVPSGPVHARASVDPARLRVGDRVVVTPSLLETGPLLIQLDGADVWRGTLPTAAVDLGPAVEMLEQAPPSSLGFVPDTDMLRRGDLVGLAGSIGGVGPGLTPAGDDCLAGILLIARMRWGPLDEDVLARARTNDIALAFLRWAARGQSIEPVHRFLACAADGADAIAVADALEAVIGFGHSSGADLALGLRLALQHLPLRR